MSIDTNRQTLLRTLAYGAAVLAFVHATLSALPSSHITIGAGPQGGTYYETSLQYKKYLEDKGYKVDVIAFDNTEEIAGQVNNAETNIDVGFVAQDLRGKNVGNIVTLGDIQIQPLFIFANRAASGVQEIRTFSQLRGMRIALPPEQSVTSQAVLKIFSLCDIDRQNTVIQFLSLKDAVQQLKEQKFDFGIFMLSAENEFVVDMAKSKNLKLIDMTQIEAIAKQFSFLQPSLLPAGIYDLKQQIPETDIPVLAAKISIVVKKNLASGAVYALLDAMSEVHRKESYVSRLREFPSYLGTDLPIHTLAPDFYRSGTPWIYANLPIRLAGVIDRYLVSFLAVWFLVGVWRGISSLDGLRKFVLETMCRLTLKWIQYRAVPGKALSSRELRTIEKIEQWIFQEEERANLKSLLNKLKAVGAGSADSTGTIQADVMQSMRESYDHYFSSTGYHRRYPTPNYSTLKRIMASGVDKAENILDFGCGNGRYGLALLERTQARITAYDISQASLEEFESRLHRTAYRDRVTLVHGAIERLEKNEPYDVVLMLFGVLSHLGVYQQRIDALRTVRALIAADGQLIVSVPCIFRRRPLELLKFGIIRRFGKAGALQNEPGNILFSRFICGKSISFFYHLYSVRSLRTELIQAGFRIRACKPECFLPEWLIAQSRLARWLDKLVLPWLPASLGYGIYVIADPN
jgi:TRAP-type uncharacterized transport system substrate-binding protein/2-polyprenyl-3-methyl-5-hydroxy-6-metoxy-1,4-benzoquinol methylase